jgi:hypothetical protein
MRRPIDGPAEPVLPPSSHPYDAEIEAERTGWYEVTRLVHSLDVAEILEPGYYRDPDWSVRDMVGHLGMWLAEAGIQLERIRSGTYQPSEVDIDALNAEFRGAMRGQPWSVVFSQAQASRSRMLQDWYALSERSAAAAWWVAKSGAEHYDEHLDRLREWVSELRARRRGALGQGPEPTAAR